MRRPQRSAITTALVLAFSVCAFAQEAPSRLFKQLDKNGDGKLSAEEFPYPVVFKQLDKDGDGSLSPKEAEAIPTRGNAPPTSAAPAPANPSKAATTPTAKPDSKPDSELVAPIPLSEVPRNDTAETPLARLIFTQDYFPGRKDSLGQFMGGTEAMWLAGHNGQLFAAIGYAADRPGDDPQPGAQIICKDSPDGNWRVEHSFGPGCMRVETLVSFAFVTDAKGKRLEPPVQRLVASPSELQRSSPNSAVFIRDDASGKWLRSDIASGNLGVRAFGSHVDRVTGVHHVFAGLNRGGIVRGSYDPAAPGGIRWEPESERDTAAYRSDGKVYDFSRVLCFAECNGDLYMASRITLDAANKPVDGGLYRRVDGQKPAWKLVSRWTVDPEILQSRYLRGLTAVPDPAGDKHEVLVANFEYPGTLVHFDPKKTDHDGLIASELEIDIKAYFNEAWNTPNARRRGAIAAYNRFLPVTDPQSGEPLWLAGAWVERPGSPNPPHNGSCYVIRHRDGRYDWGYIYDASHPIAAGHKLTGCRDIEPSPFPGEAGSVFYFCGYDGGVGPGHNTAWIYRGSVSQSDNLPSKTRRAQ
jgi:hypothetical protein